MNLLRTLRRLILSIAGKLGWLPPTLARLTLGWLFLTSGWGKLHNIQQVTEYFQSLGIPHPELQAPFASGVEFVCGGLILVGLLTRVAAVPLIVTMAVAIVSAKKESISAVDDLFSIVEYLYILLLVWLGVSGAGPLSLDWLLSRRLFAQDRGSVRGVSGAERVA